MGKYEEMTRSEIVERRRQLEREMTSMIGRQKFVGHLSDEEERRYNDHAAELKDITLELARRGKDDAKAGREVSRLAAKSSDKRFSLRRAISAMCENRQQRDTEAAVLEEGRRMSRGLPNSAGAIYIPLESRAALTAAAGGGVVETESMETLLPLLPNLVLAKAGAAVVTGLSGDIAWPSYSGTKVEWEGETDEAADGTGSISAGKVFKPHRLSAYLDISKQLLLQSSDGVEVMLRQSMAAAMAAKVEATAFGTSDGSDTAPGGMFAGFNSASKYLSWEEVVAMETELATSDALTGSLAYIMHPTLLGLAKAVAKDPSGAGGLILNGTRGEMFNGYSSYRTTAMPSNLGTGGDGYGMVFGNWRDYLVGSWGAVELLVDPYTQATKGCVRIVLNSYWDFGPIRDESFVLAAFKGTKGNA